MWKYLGCHIYPTKNKIKPCSQQGNYYSQFPATNSVISTANNGEISLLSTHKIFTPLPLRLLSLPPLLTTTAMQPHLLLLNLYCCLRWTKGGFRMVIEIVDVQSTRKIWFRCCTIRTTMKSYCYCFIFFTPK